MSIFENIRKHTKTMKYIIYDLETTGLPIKNAGMSFTDQPDPRDLNKYAGARVLQIGAVVYDSTAGTETVYNWFIKVDFAIPKSQYHRITNEICNAKGISIVDAAKGFAELLDSSDMLISYNIGFDYNVLLSELYRVALEDIAQKMVKIKKECAMEYGKTITGRYSTLINLYKMCVADKLYGDDNAHDAIADVIATQKILLKTGFYDQSN